MIKRTPTSRTPAQRSAYAKRKKLVTLKMDRARRAAAKGGRRWTS